MSIALVGSNGRMSLALQECLKEASRDFKILSPRATHHKIETLRGMKGVIDFSTPETSFKILQNAVEARTPYVCGTTGWKSLAEMEKEFKKAAGTIPVLWDSNFSLGIEVLCQAAEIMARAYGGSIKIVDIHHQHKKDAPSGTALKIQKRIQDSSSKTLVDVDSIREGEVFGIHKILMKHKNETLEFVHEAHSRKLFAEGAIRAFDWLCARKPGFYSMKDVLK